MFRTLSFRTYFVGIIVLAFFLPFLDRVVGNGWIVTGIAIAYLIGLRLLAELLESRKEQSLATRNILETDEKKRRLIEKLSNEGRVLSVFFAEKPMGDFAWQAVREGITRILPPYDYAALDAWWHEGNWQAISPGSDDFEPMDTFRVRPALVRQEMEKHGVSLVIDSFHDNVEWNVIELAE